MRGNPAITRSFEKIKALYGLICLVIVISFSSSATASPFPYSINLYPGGTGPSLEEVFGRAKGYLYSDPDEARKLALHALELAFNHPDQNLRIQLLNFIGISHMVQSAYDSALFYYYDAKTLSEHLEIPLQVGNSLNNIAVAHGDMGNYKDALRFFLQALDEYEKIGKDDSRAFVYTNMGMIYAEIDNPEKAKTNYQNAYAIFHNLKDSIRIGTLLTNMGTLYLNLGQREKAHSYIDSAIIYKELTHDKYGLCSALEKKARTLFADSLFNQAVDHYSMALLIAEEIGFDSGKASIYTGLAELSMQLGQLAEAREYAEKAIDTANDIENLKLKYKAHEVLSNIFQQEGNYQESLDHYHKYNFLKNESINQNRLHQVYNLELERAAEKGLREIHQREIMLGRKNTTIFLISLVFFATLVIISLLYYVIRNRQRQKEKRQENDALMKLTEARTSSALEAEVAERKRLSFELHDGVGPLLSLAKLNVTALIQKPDLPAERKEDILKNTEGTINEILKEMKQISNNMAPLVLMEKGFSEAARELVQKIDQSGHYKVTLEMMGLNGQMKSYLEHALYRTMQEALNNIIMHAEGSEINIQVIQTPADLTVMIEDNGKGFITNPRDGNKGLGLKSAASRIQSLNGELLIDSVKGRGTIVTIIVPLTQNNN